ncbi:hypothetical protein O6H91_Y368000 [Diphasiastrum complanatum]|nr:hypothetical protein O6H91_Y368000 [Diphasiastrum complanatum]
MGDLFSNMVLLIQDDAAIRFTNSSPESDDYRPISLFINFYSVLEYKLKVERANFFPQPQVDAAVVSFAIKRPLEYPHVDSQRAFFSLVNSAFNSKRKMLRKSLQHIFCSSDIQSALSQVGLPETSRPGELTLDQFVELHNVLRLHQTSNLL